MFDDCMICGGFVEYDFQGGVMIVSDITCSCQPFEAELVKREGSQDV